MAYLDLNLPSAAASGERQERGTDPARRASGFSGLEWSVIALARREGLATLKEPSRISKALASLFGLHRGSRLADERLEALRRMAILGWR